MKKIFLVMYLRRDVMASYLRKTCVLCAFFAVLTLSGPEACEIWIGEWKAGMDGSMTQLHHDVTPV